MPWQKRSKPKLKAERVVRHKLSTGQIKEYRYATYDKKPVPQRRDTMAGLIYAYQNSPEWRGLAASTQGLYAIYLRPFDAVSGDNPATVKRRDILTARNAIATTRGNGAASNFTLVAGALFRWAVNQDWLEHSPVHDIEPLPRGHLPAWTAEEAARAIGNAQNTFEQRLPEPFRRVVVLALYTGQRRGDLCAMGWSAYDGKSIRLVQQKTGKPLVIPVHPELKAELDRWERITTTILSNGARAPWRPVLLSDQLPGKLQTIGLRKGLNVHGLRKLAATNLAEAGCTLHEIASITGHASLGMLQLYTASADQERMATAAIVRLTKGKKS